MILTAICTFIIGAMIGSFLSVLISRMHSGKKGIIFGRSECPNCKTKLRFADLIPLFSYIFSLGKCRHCKKPIGMWYFLLEIITGIIFTALYFKFPFSSNEIIILYAYYAIVSVALIGILFYDFKHMEIPEIFTLPVIFIIFISSFFIKFPGIYDMLIGGAVAGLFFGFQVILSKEQWMGAGDTQVGILLGMLFGWKYLIMCLLIAYVVGSLISMILLISGKVKGKTQIPFAPFLVFAAFIVMFFGDYIYKLYESTLL